MSSFSGQNYNIVSSVQPLLQQQQQQGPRLPKRSFNLPISNKSNTQYQEALKQKNEITIKIEKLSELKAHDEPKIYYSSKPVDFTRRDAESLNANLALISASGPIKPIRTRQFLLSTYTESYEAIYGVTKAEVQVTLQDPFDAIISENHKRFDPLTFNKEAIKVGKDGITYEISVPKFEIPTSAKKRPLHELDTVTIMPQKKKHRYDMPLESSRTISAKEVLRMVDSSLISSDMDSSQNNTTSTSMILNDITNSNTPLKAIPSYLKFFNNNNGNLLNENTPLKNAILSSTPQGNNTKFLSFQDEEFKYSPVNGSKLRHM